MLLAAHDIGVLVVVYLLIAPFASCQFHIPRIIQPPWVLFCGITGNACCRPSFPTSPVYGPLVSCGVGLGCDITTLRGTCVSPCGSPGEVCCDGGDTRALQWTKQGVVSPMGPSLKEMCMDGYCDKSSHRYVACHSAEGNPCCPPDASQATARCNGPNLECRFDNPSATSGTCISCGGLDQPPCGGKCTPGLSIRNGLCVFCGNSDQVACDVPEYHCNYGCNSGLILTAGMCRFCGDTGQIPCGVPAASCIQNTFWYHCKQGLGMRQGLCQLCGTEGKSPCDNGSVVGLALKHRLCTALCGHFYQPTCDNGACLAPLQEIAGLCEMCGTQSTLPCPSGGCRYPLKVRQGRCAQCDSNNMLYCKAGGDPGLLPEHHLSSNQCGLEAYPPCDSGCRDGRTVNNVGLCVGAATCAGEGEACVSGQDHMTIGTLCSESGGPFVCNFGTCRRCNPHGQEVPLGGTQICCDRDDFPVLDGFGQKCDIPDGPKNS